MRIAMIGQKGLPATHGGVEHHVEQIGSRLAARGHEVLVYTRPSYSDPNLEEHKGMRLRSIPSIPTKHLDAITHSALSSWDSRFRPLDIVHYHAIGPSLTAPMARMAGRHIVATIHGQDWRRAKWNGVARTALRIAEHSALAIPDATISVSKSLAESYERDGWRSVHYIPNGVSVAADHDPEVLARFGLAPEGYVVYAGRLVPEKGAHYLLEAWRSLDTGLKLVIVGDSSFTDGYVDELKRIDPAAVFTGYQYGAALATLMREAALFVLPSDLEGLPIVLLESLALGTPVLASDIAPNREVLGLDGAYFRAGDVGSLQQKLSELLSSLSQMKSAAALKRDTVMLEYDWERVVDQLEQLYRSLG